jgi:positive regulator of sigma E activity
MFREIVEIVEKQNGRLKVRFKKSILCSCCRFNFLCSNSQQSLSLEDDSNLNLRVGDKIEIGIEERKQLLSSLILYLFPAIIFLATLIVSKKFLKELETFFVGIVSIAIYYLLIRIIMKKLKPNLNLKIIRKV